MPTSHGPRRDEIDARSLKLHFSLTVKQALQDLEAAVHFNEKFSGDIRPILHEWAKGETQTVHDVLIALPLLAKEVFEHIRTTGDERAADAWDEFSAQMSERGFIVMRPRTVGRS
jgi:hypothetical protein